MGFPERSRHRVGYIVPNRDKEKALDNGFRIGVIFFYFKKVSRLYITISRKKNISCNHARRLWILVIIIPPNYEPISWTAWGMSSICKIEVRVTQDSILVPRLFTLPVNGLLKAITSGHIQMYADEELEEIVNKLNDLFKNLLDSC